MKYIRSVRFWLAIHIRSWRRYLLTEEEQKKLVLLEIREHFQFLGFNCSDLTDDQIQLGALRFSELLDRTRLTAEELSAAILKMGAL